MVEASTAGACPRCGEPLTAPMWCDRCQRRTTPATVIRFEERSSGRGPRRWQVNRKYLHFHSALLSPVIPGAGQAYKGRVAVGVAWLLVVAAGYWLVGSPGLLIHLMCVVMAGSAPVIRRRPFLSDRFGWRRQ